MKFEVRKHGDTINACLHSVDSLCCGSVSEQQLREFSEKLLQLADGKIKQAEINVPWEPED